MLLYLIIALAAFGAGMLTAVLPDHLEIRKERKLRERRAHWERKLTQEGWSRPWAS